VIDLLERLFDLPFDSRSLAREMLELAHMLHPGLLVRRGFRRLLHFFNYLIDNFSLSLNCALGGEKKQVPHRASARFGMTETW